MRKLAKLSILFLFVMLTSLSLSAISFAAEQSISPSVSFKNGISQNSKPIALEQNLKLGGANVEFENIKNPRQS